MKVRIPKIMPELVFDIKGIRLYKYKYPHFGYFGYWGGLSKTSTRRRDLITESRRCCSDYVYRMCFTQEGLDNLNNNTEIYNIEKITGQKVRDLVHLWRNDEITFSDWDDFTKDIVYDEAYYNEEDYYTDPVLTEEELKQQKIINKDKLLEGLFGNAFRMLGEKYGYEFKKFENGFAKIDWRWKPNEITKQLTKIVEDTIIKDLNNLGFDVEFNPNQFISLFTSGDIIHSIRVKDELFEKENPDESNIERGEN